MAVGVGCKARVPAKGTGDGSMRPRDGRLDASPRGGEPGFVPVVDETTLWIPDAPGNNRLDSFANIVETGRVGMLFLIPGIDETLRVNGRAHLSTDPDKREQLATPPMDAQSRRVGGGGIPPLPQSVDEVETVGGRKSARPVGAAVTGANAEGSDGQPRTGGNAGRNAGSLRTPLVTAFFA